MLAKKIAVVLLFGFCLSGEISSATALVLGILWTLCFGLPFDSSATKKTQTLLLQAAVVGLGAGMNLVDVLKQGASSIPSTLMALVAILSVGLLLSRLWGLNSNLGWLISSGTAICGGSAIAAVAPTIRAKSEETTAALGVVFLLNAVALVLFPTLGAHFGMSEHQFGIFAALAIHDTSSVVGAASHYGPEALAIATTTKLVRALWIIPLCLAIVFLRRAQKEKISIPVFIFLFIALSGLVTWVGPWVGFDWIYGSARRLLIGAIFLIGLSLSLKNLKRMGPRVAGMGLSLWVFSIALSFFLSK